MSIREPDHLHMPAQEHAWKCLAGLLLVLGVLIVCFSWIAQTNQVDAFPNAAAFPISNAPLGQVQPAVAYNVDMDEFIVVWNDMRNGDSDIYAQRIGSDSQLLGEELIISSALGAQQSPEVVARVDSTDFLVAWRDDRNFDTTDTDIYAQVVRAGTLYNTNQPINTNPGRIEGVNVSFCPPSDSYFIAWHEDEDAQADWEYFVYGRQVSNEGTAAGDIKLITADYPEPALQQQSPDLAFNSLSGNLLAVYRDARNADFGTQYNDDIYGQFLDCAGEVLQTEDFPVSMQYSEPPRGNKQNTPTIAYDHEHNHFLVVWQDERHDIVPGGADTLDIYGQLLSGDGRPLCSSPLFNFEITMTDNNQRDPVVAYGSRFDVFMVVWTDYRNGDGDIYAQLVTSDGRLLGEEIIISDAVGDQTLPAITYHPQSGQFLIVWQDGRNQASNGMDIYGKFYLPTELPSPLTGDYLIYLPLIGNNAYFLPERAEENAYCWVRGQMVNYPHVEDVPGYDRNSCTGQISRYKDTEACYPAIPGKAVVSFDYCNYGTPEQQTRLGHYGRSSLYDQAVAAVTLLMLNQDEEAQLLLDYLSSYQNFDVSVEGAADGSLGFQFNTTGCFTDAPDNRDSFYDINYLRNGAISWVGYAYTMYQRMTGDTRYQSVAIDIADYLLTEQIPAGQAGAGLIRGGYGDYDADGNFTPGDISWASTEHNIDAYFFFRDLGVVTGNNTYSNAASEIKDAILSDLWNDELGRLDQGLNDPADALDASSWGAVFLIAVGEDAKASRSLDYAEQMYWNSVGDVSGYKPYAGIIADMNWDDVELVWSEGSLGVAMAYLKLGDSVSEGRAVAILGEMTELQLEDFAGGLFYAFYDETMPVPGFPEAPSVAGTGWYIMTLQALSNSEMRDAFWGSAP